MPLAEFVANCKKTVQVLFPHPTLTGISHTTNNTMPDYYSSATTATNATANTAKGSTTNKEEDISGNKDALEDDSKDKASDDDEGTEGALFCAARDIQFQNAPLNWGWLVWRTATFAILLAQIYPS